MSLGSDILKSINQILLFLIEKGLATDQNPPILKNGIVSWANYTPGLGFGSELDYLSIYSEIEKYKNYTIKLIDGGLLQFYYKISRKHIIEHRLAFYPNPLLEDYDSVAADYEMDEIYLEVIDKYLLKTPLRFDFDENDQRHRILLEPKGHLHLGHTENCRIPTTKPVCPYTFIKFVIINFYNHFYTKFIEESFFRNSINTGSLTIHEEETKILHLNCCR